jgi:hypothetical protein
MIVNRPYVIIAAVIIIAILVLWLKSHETRVLPNILDSEEEEKEILLTSINGQKRITLITLQGYKIDYGNLDIAQGLKRQVSQITSARDSTSKIVLQKHIYLLENLQKDTIIYERKGYFYINTDLYSALEPWQTYKLLLEGKAEVAYMDNSHKLNEIKAMVRKSGDMDISVTFLTQMQDTIYRVVLVMFE